MTSFQTTISPNRRAAARFVTQVRRSLQKALVEENRKRGLTQSDIARKIGVHRSVINREIRGFKDITLSRVAELAFALGRKPLLELLEPIVRDGANITTITQSQSSTSHAALPLPAEQVQITSKAA